MLNAAKTLRVPSILELDPGRVAGTQRLGWVSPRQGLDARLVVHAEDGRSPRRLDIQLAHPLDFGIAVQRKIGRCRRNWTAARRYLTL
jgi:hypothetical protein